MDQDAPRKWMDLSRPAAPETPGESESDTPAVPSPTAPPERLQKVLARCGVASRRACEEYIVQGRVRVDGKVVTELGTRVDPVNAIIHVDGKRVFLNDRNVTMILHKPAGVVCSMKDEAGRPDLSQYTNKIKERLYHVGRLDQDTEGLLILTNDGELANRLQHPKYEVPKTYVAVVQGAVGKGVMRDLRRGVQLEDGPVKPDEVRILGTYRNITEVEITLHEGRNRIVRRLWSHLGHPVQRLVRTRIANLTLQGIKPGKMRRLTNQELSELMSKVGL